jgi:hypothetical protein
MGISTLLTSFEKDHSLYILQKKKSLAEISTTTVRYATDTGNENLLYITHAPFLFSPVQVNLETLLINHCSCLDNIRSTLVQHVNWFKDICSDWSIRELTAFCNVNN